MSQRRSLMCALATIMLCITMALAGTMQLASAFAEEADVAPWDEASLGAPAHSKTVTDNGDGTYTVSLSVTGASQQSTEAAPIDIILVMDTSGSMDETEGGGWWDPNSETRLDIAKNAANSLIGALLTDANAKLDPSQQVQVSVIDFSTRASAPSSFTADASSARDIINGLEADGGTNWDAGLRSANNASSNRAGAQKYIVFLSDGEPTYRLSESGDRVLGDGQSDRGGRNYDAAVDTANKRGNATLFSISNASESVDKMNQFATDTKGKFYDGTNKEALQNAFADIANIINKAATYQNVTMTDTLSAYVEFANVNADGTTPADLKGTKTDAQGNKTDLSPAPRFEDGKIVWGSGEGELEAGATYTVSFTVKPSQAAYDKAAAEGSNGKLALETNGGATLDYEIVHKENGAVTGTESGNTTFEKPTIDVPYATLNLEKQWKNDNPANRPDTVTVQLQRDGQDWGDPITLTEAAGWKTTVQVPAGASDAAWSVVEQTVPNYASQPSGPVTVTAGVAGAYGLSVANTKNTGDVTIGKHVTVSDGHAVSNPGPDFTFQVSLKDAQGNPLTGEYQIADSDQTITDGDTITLKKEQSLTIKNLPENAKVEVTEVNIPAGFTPTADKPQSVTVAANQATSLMFTNNYEATPTELQAGRISGAKVLTGRDWNDTDAFTFAINAGKDTSGEPLPNPSTVTVTKQNVGDDGNASFQFGASTFTRPGTYVYDVIEQAPTQPIAQVDYSDALYRVTVVVSDKNGQLAIDSTTMKKITDDAGKDVAPDTDAASAVFTNVFSPNASKYAFAGTKMYSNDTTGSTTPEDNAFAFELRPVTEGAPMPKDGTETDDQGQYYVAHNDGNSIAFGSIEFTKDMIGKTYEYTATEQLPAGVSQDNPTKDGITYDTATHTITVTVGQDESGNVKVSVEYDGNPENRTVPFTNSYRAQDLVLSGGTAIQGAKTLSGRDMVEGESFDFTLTPADGVTGTAVQNKWIELGSTTAQVTGAKDGVAASFDFGTATFHRVGTYTFNITETGHTGESLPSDGTDGMTYDRHAGKVTVTVTDENGVLKGQVSYGNATPDANASNAFVNTYAAKFDGSTAVSLTGTKTLSGIALTKDAFTFTVTKPDGSTMEMRNAADEDGNGTADIALLANETYQAAGTYEYTIVEKNDGKTGYTYDTTQYKVSVVVTDDGKGTLSAGTPEIKKGTDGGATWTDTDAVAFGNSYAPLSVTHTPLKATKVLQGDKQLEEDAFQFVLSATGNPSDGVQLPEVTQVGNAADGSIQFADVKFTKVGTYTLAIREVIPDDATNPSVDNGAATYGAASDSQKAQPGWTLDGVTYTVNTIQRTYKVTDDNGQLKEELTNEVGGTQFTNSYSAQGSTPESLMGTKTIEGRQFKQGDSFTFEVEGKGPNGITVPMPANAVDGILTITPDGGASSADLDFGAITFTQPGTYTYTISEQGVDGAPASGGIKDGLTYSTDQHVVTVEVTDPEKNGKLSVAVTGNDALSWTNTYAVSGESDPALISVTKHIEGHEATGSFGFKLTPAKDQATDNIVGLQDGELSVTTSDALVLGKDETLTFGGSDGLTFTAAGDYHFLISETTSDGNGWTQSDSDTAHEVVVHVTDNLDGTLSIKTTAEGAQAIDGNNPTITNVYEADGKLSISGTKRLTDSAGNEVSLGDRSWSFQIEPNDEQTSDAIGSFVFMPDPATAQSGSDGAFTFGDITFKSTGADSTTYQFAVTELHDPSVPGVTNDAHTSRIVTVEVADNGKGALTPTITAVTYEDGADASDDNSIVFTNIYGEGGSVAIAPTAEKVLNGRDQKTGEFKFEMVTRPSGENSAEPQVVMSGATSSDAANGEASPITFEPAALTFGYPELAQAVRDGYATYDADAKVWTLDYTIREITGESNSALPTGVTPEGASSYDVSFKVRDNGDGTLALVDDRQPAKVTFTNVYSAEDTLSLSGKKTLVDAANNEMPLGDRTWNFTLAADPDDQATLDAISAGAVMLPGTVITQNDVTGNFNFDSIVFRSTGAQDVSYKFVISESGDVPGVTNDTRAARTIVVNVHDNFDGTLNVSVNKDASEELSFKNTYGNESAATVSVQASKELTGREMKKGEFHFDIVTRPNEGAAQPARIIATGTNGAPEGSVAGIEFTDQSAFEYSLAELGQAVQDGYATFNEVSRTWTLSYTISEDLTGLPNGVAPAEGSSTSYDFQVTVTDNGDGTLDANTSYPEGADAFVFKNTYRAQTGEGAVQLAGTKELTGRPLQDKEFSFEVKDADGAVVATAQNDKNGALSFSDIKYTLAYDAESGKTYVTGQGADSQQRVEADENGQYVFTYTVSEVTTNLPGGVEPDKNASSFNVTVTLTDNGDGTLTPQITYPEGSESGLAFKNTYLQGREVSATIEGTKTMAGLPEGQQMQPGDYSFELKALDETDPNRDSVVTLASVDENGDGHFSFADLKYDISDLAGIEYVDDGNGGQIRSRDFNYRVTEINDQKFGVTYDERAWIVTITLTDNGKGGLNASVTDAHREDGTSVDPKLVTFANEYSVESTQWRPQGSKSTIALNGADLTGKTFGFVVTDDAAPNDDPVSTGVADANGAINFTPIQLPGTGEYDYIVRELLSGAESDEQAGIIYDDVTWHIHLTVERTGNGTYSYTPTYTCSNGLTGDGVSFNNTYVSTGTSIDLSATKTITAPHTAAGFQFTVIDEQDGQQVAAGVSDESGAVKFNTIYYRNGETTIALPAVTGMTAEAATAVLTEVQLQSTVVTDESAPAPTAEQAGQVYKVVVNGAEVASGTKIPTNAVVELHVYGAFVEQPTTPEDGIATPDGSTTPDNGSSSEAGTEVTDPTTPTEPATPTDPTEPTDPVEPEPSEPSDSANPEPVEPTEPADPADPVTPADPTLPGDEGTVEPEAPVDTPESSEAVTPDVPVDEPEAPVADAASPETTPEPEAEVAPADDVADEAATPEAEVLDAEAGDPAIASIVDAFAPSVAIADDENAEPYEPVDPGISVDSTDLGDHWYTIAEVNDGQDGVTYDETTYRVRVSVTDDGKGQMHAAVAEVVRVDSAGETPVNGIGDVVFNNTYKANHPTTVTFEGTKTLTGRDANEGEFSFSITNAATGELVAGGQSAAAADGQAAPITFGSLEFTEAGEYDFVVSESKGGTTVAGVTYDDAVFNVHASVVDNGDGTLTATVSYPDGPIAFVNSYQATQGTSAMLEGTKVLTGRSAADGEFGFVIKDESGTTVATGRSTAAAEGAPTTIEFGKLNYDAQDVGDHTYTVSEVNAGQTLAGITFDTAQFRVTVHVIDNLDGTLSTKVDYLDGPIAFRNTYGATGGDASTVTPTATKTLTGRELQAGEFTFALKDAADGSTVSTTTNAADGSVTFPSLRYDEVGEHEYTINEVAGREEGMTYDTTTYRLQVSVTDDGKGNLVATATCPDGQPSFKNAYEKPAELETPSTPETPGTPGRPSKPSIPKTGDPTGPMALVSAVMGTLVLGGAAVLLRKRTRIEQ